MTSAGKLIYSVIKGYSINELGEVKGPSGKVLSLSKDKYGHLSFNIRIPGRQPTRVFAHRLQGFKKFGLKIFEPGMVIRHLNGISTDNSIDNIGIGTNRDNSMDIPKDLRRLYASHPRYDHKSIIEDREKGMSYKEIMEKYKISSKGTVSYIVLKSLEKKR